MNQLYKTAIFSLLYLMSFTISGAIVKPKSAIAMFKTKEVANTAILQRSRYAIALNTGNLLSSRQKAQLAKLDIPKVLPDYLPNGFGVTKFSAENDQGDGSWYSIIYQRSDKTCLEISANVDPAMALSGLQQTSVTTRLGKVKVYSGTVEGKPIIVGLLSLPNNNNGYMVRTGGWIPQTSSATRCNPVSMKEYIPVLKSLTRLK